ncbi:hypothetical protein KLP40_18250 [Hymenobacter sp. NST-14]|uniref:hypothetical protein n=1 Tax=Hymenobacter piscis TaxID=2839984 RepID=UPI001C015F77|nr:hypothetical protein [Hymenobacter piscis]MBT9395115.1 hypothetical protein [Hymenobacter piscis]
MSCLIKRIRPLLLALALLVPQLSPAQCVLCSTQVEAARTEKDGYQADGLNTGILYLMAIPYVLMGTVGFIWYRYGRQRNPDSPPAPA